MLMFSLLELLNTQRTQEERDSFQFSQRGQLQVHAFDKGSPPHKTGEWKLMYDSHYPFHSFLWHSGWMVGQNNGELWREEGRMGMRRSREAGHEDTFPRRLSLRYWLEKVWSRQKGHCWTDVFWVFLYTWYNGLLLGQWYVVYVIKNSNHITWSFRNIPTFGAKLLIMVLIFLI